MSQNSIVLPTSGTLGGLQGITDINAALDTLNTKWAGASAPATPELGQEWLDTSTTPNTLRIYDGSAWVARAWLDTANGLWQPLPTGGLIAVGSITLDHTYVGRLVADNAAGVTITLPSAASIPAGMRIAFVHQQGGTMTLQRNGSDSLMGPDGWNATSLTLSELGDFVEFECDGSSHWYQTGKAAPFAGAAATQTGTDAGSSVTPAGLAATILASPAQAQYNEGPSRALNTTYTNSTGRPIFVWIVISGGSGTSFGLLVNGQQLATAGNAGSTTTQMAVAAIVMPGFTYEIIGSSISIYSWWELR